MGDIIFWTFLALVWLNLITGCFDGRKYKRKVEVAEDRIRRLQQANNVIERDLRHQNNRLREQVMELKGIPLPHGVIDGTMSSYLSYLEVMKDADWEEGDEDKLNEMWKSEQLKLAVYHALNPNWRGQ